MPKGWNDTLIVLILKNNNPMKINDMRPISLCNVAYKVVAKVLTNKLKLTLPHIIYHNQSAFAPSHIISGNILLAYELTRYLQNKRKGGHKLTSRFTEGWNCLCCLMRPSMLQIRPKSHIARKEMFPISQLMRIEKESQKRRNPPRLVRDNRQRLLDSPASRNEMPKLELPWAWEPSGSSRASQCCEARRAHSSFCHGNKD